MHQDQGERKVILLVWTFLFKFKNTGDAGDTGPQGMLGPDGEPGKEGPKGDMGDQGLLYL